MTASDKRPAPLGTDYLLAALADEELSHLFMVPGGLVDPFLPALTRQSRLKPVIAAHEGGAVYMADGYARGSGGQDRRLARSGDDRRGAGRHGGPRRVPGREPGDARRHRGDGAADAAVEDGRGCEKPQPLAPPR